MGLLPTPLVQITHQAFQTSDFSNTRVSTVTPTFAPLSLQDIALQTYGERLIRRIAISSIALDSPVVTVGWRTDWNSKQPMPSEWDSPGAAVGWVLTSVLPDQAGNIILYGHNNMYGSVFRDLGKLGNGDRIILQTGQRSWQYQVDRVVLLPITGANASQQSSYQSFLAETSLPRLTIISCWPPESNTYRLIIIAYPQQTL